MLPELKVVQIESVPINLHVVKNPHDAIRQNTCDLYAYLWPAGLVCSEYIYKNKIRGRVLEIGCGNGISGVTALVSGAASVHFTDISTEALELSELNCTLNGVEGSSFSILDWFNLPEMDDQFDFIIASDCMYLSRTFSKLCNLISKFLKADGMAIFADAGRGLVDEFIDKLESFDIKRIDYHNKSTMAGDLKMATILLISKKENK